MPMYDISCKTCDARQTIFRIIAEYNNLPACACGGSFERRISAPMVRASIEPYLSPGTGKWIDSREKRNEDLRASKAYLHESGIEKDIARNKEANLEKSFAPIAEAVDQTVSQLVAAGKIES